MGGTNIATSDNVQFVTIYLIKEKKALCAGEERKSEKESDGVRSQRLGTMDRALPVFLPVAEKSH